MKYLLLLLVLWSGLWVQPAEAACTKGTNCYADNVANSGHAFYDVNRLLVEDFDCPTLYSNTGYGTTTSPCYGPQYDETNGGWGGFNRGYNAYWNRKYGNGGDSYTIPTGDPASPTFGVTCNVGAGGACVGHRVWHPANLWNMNALTPSTAFYSTASEFDDENAAIHAPTNTASGTAGIFDGNAIHVFRLATTQTTGVAGETAWTASTHIGCTLAMAFPSNLNTSGVRSGAGDHNWKFNEFIQVGQPNWGWDGLCGFGNSGDSQFPAYWFAYEGDQTRCLAIIAGAITHVGRSLQCSDGYIGFWGKSDYVFGTQWPLETWGCIRTEFDMGAGVYKMWLKTTVYTTETLVMYVSGMNFSGTLIGQGYKGMKWNAYVNANQPGGGGPTTAVTYRYMDNVHIRNGTPVSCAQIGFTGGGGDVTPPAAPTGVQISQPDAPTNLHLTGSR
jgi:hypothetical protein